VIARLLVDQVLVPIMLAYVAGTEAGKGWVAWQVATPEQRTTRLAIYTGVSFVVLTMLALRAVWTGVAMFM